jgi:NAD-dependent dihydropyrimidine dehydrogenase PreA subunit
LQSADPDGCWSTRESLWDQKGAPRAVVKVSILPMELANFCATLESSCKAAKSIGGKSSFRARGGSAADRSGRISQLVDTLTRLRAHAEKSGGSLVVLSAPPEIREALRCVGRSGRRAAADARGKAATRSSWDSESGPIRGRHLMAAHEGIQIATAPNSSAPCSAFDSHHPPPAKLIDECVHCGFCLPTCPTYSLWGEEMDSPRGRIYLMKMASEGLVQLEETFVQHFDTLPGLHGVHDGVPVRGEVRQAV